jgi:Ca2+-binding EF-hand superfamily protein
LEVSAIEKMDEKRARISEIFHEIDVDRSGFLSFKELKKGMDQLGMDLDDQTIISLVITFDEHGTGELDLEGFSKMVLADDLQAASSKASRMSILRRDAQRIRKESQNKRLTDEEMGTVIKKFQDIDEDGSGSISYSELRVGMQSLGLELDENRVAALVVAFDKNRDGELQLDEFKNMMVAELGNRITKERERPAAPAVGEKLLLETLAQIEAVFKQADASGKGRLSFEDLKDGLTKRFQLQHILDTAENDNRAAVKNPRRPPGPAPDQTSFKRREERLTGTGGKRKKEKKGEGQKQGGDGQKEQNGDLTESLKSDGNAGHAVKEGQEQKVKQETQEQAQQKVVEEQAEQRAAEDQAKAATKIQAVKRGNADRRQSQLRRDEAAAVAAIYTAAASAEAVERVSVEFGEKEAKQEGEAGKKGEDAKVEKSNTKFVQSEEKEAQMGSTSAAGETAKEKAKSVQDISVKTFSPPSLLSRKSMTRIEVEAQQEAEAEIRAEADAIAAAKAEKEKRRSVVKEKAKVKAKKKLKGEAKAKMFAAKAKKRLKAKAKARAMAAEQKEKEGNEAKEAERKPEDSNQEESEDESDATDSDEETDDDDNDSDESEEESEEESSEDEDEDESGSDVSESDEEE